MGERIEFTQVDRSERGFATTIEANPELDLRNAARSKIANVSVISTAARGVVTIIRGSARTVIAVVIPTSVGVASVGVGSVIGVSRYEMTLVVENGIFGKIGGDTKDGIESVSLNSGLNGGSGGSGSYSISTSAASSNVSLASVHELVAHGLGYNADVLSRTVGIRFYAGFKTGSAPHETYTEMR